MWKLGRKGRAAFVGAAAIAGATVLVGASPSATATTGATAAPTPPVGFTDAGRIEIQTNRGTATSANEFTKSTGAVHYYAPGATAPTTVTFDGLNLCHVANTAQIATLLAITPTGGTLGFRDAGLGVRTKNNCYRDGARVDGGQALTLSLDGTTLGANVRISRAELDMEGKGGTNLAYTLDGAAQSPAILNSSQDNGPDSGSTDNTRIVIAPTTPFRTITLSPTNAQKGQVSLEGGGDFATAAQQQANRSILYLVQEEGHSVGCGEPLPLTFEGTVRSAIYVRAVDAFKNDVCVDISVVLKLDGQGRLLLDTVGAIPAGQELSGQITIEWVVDRFNPAGVLKSAAEINAELAREIDFVPGPPEEFAAVQWCSSTGGTGTVHPADAPWCLVSDQQVLVGDQIIQTQVYVGEEDPMWR